MTKQEYLAASLSLPYELKIMVLYIENGLEVSRKIKPLTGYTIEKSVPGGYFAKVGYFRDEEFRSEKNILPIIRPLDSLTKECVQSDYNDGKPFIPIKELERLFPIWCLYLLDDNGKTVVGFHQRDYDDVTIEDIILVIQQLLRWHYWLNMPESEEVVYVTDEFNPYK